MGRTPKEARCAGGGGVEQKRARNGGVGRESRKLASKNVSECPKKEEEGHRFRCSKTRPHQRTKRSGKRIGKNSAVSGAVMKER